MGHTSTPFDQSFQWFGATRVVIERSRLPNWKELTVSAPSRDEFAVLPCSGPIIEILAQCKEIAPCVLIASQKSIEKLSANDLNGSVGMGGPVRVLVWGTHASADLVEKFLCMGCMGCLPHDVPRSTLWKAVRAIACGEVWAGRKAVSQAMRKLILKQSVLGLTAREQEILRMIADGLSNRVIADRLYITYERSVGTSELYTPRSGLQTGSAR